ncbi:MAG: PsbP-related protein [Acidimicrobiia bacterium]|nr:PsbP-related protein [Acidimicrobiia bacterium]
MRPLILCLVVALVACGNNTASTTSTPSATSTIPFDPASLVLYESERHGFAIAYPQDWTVTEVDAENLVGFTAPSGGTALTPNFNVTVTDVDPELPATAYYEGEIERVSTALENAEILEVANVNVDGVLGRGLTLVTTQQGIDIGISRIIVLNEGRAYELSFFAEARRLEQLAPMVSSIFQSLRFIP